MIKLRKQFTNSISSNEINFQTIIEIKDHLLKLEDKFDKNDVLKYVNNTRQLKKFIQRKEKIEDCIQYISNILYWRKETGLSNLNLYSFPRELFTNNCYYFFDHDLSGNFCALIRAQYFVKGNTIKEMVNTYICFMCYHIIDKINEKNDESGLTLIIDCKNISISQYDFDFLLFLIDLLNTKMADILKKIILYEVPWFALPLLKTALLLIPNDWRNYVAYTNIKTIKKYISQEKLPIYLQESKRKEPIEMLVKLDETKSLKDFTEKELNLIGMKKQNIPNYLDLLEQWKRIDKINN